ncbi:FAD-dependent monooxygenase [Pseudonocardia sp. N23]|uniref:FAD-dependent monooxygenase n=1 Tax=Pseudonocardia sp. N23 TaxID=1987376 RepID=UPI000BFE575D|nr:FAD-dependent monooxygenase [Pseudonocardia sp. N23]
MELHRVAVLGGGPGGLYAARLLKLANPACEVVLHEQGEPDATFGFGVGLAAGTQRKLEAADPDTLREIVAAGLRHDMTMTVDGATARVRNDRLVGIARTELLAVLQRHAEKAGVTLHFGSRSSADDLGADDLDADVVVAADGVGSATREAGEFGPSIDVGRGLYLWCGTDFALDDAVFAPVRTEHGVFVTHAYPYAGGATAGTSTFLIETDEATWRRAGFDATTAALDADASDEVSLRYLQDAFAGTLRGHRLIGNRTRWLRFRTVRCDRWSDGRAVLLGDAAHTAHFSIGSGTKLAMEDAIALVEALREEPDRPAAFARYERVRRPSVERLQELARRSQLWWESFPDRLDLPVERLMVAYMSRAGNVPLERFASTAPDVVATALAQYGGGDPPPAGAVTDWVLDRTHPAPADLPVLDVDLDDPWSALGDAILEQARARGSRGILLSGPAARPAVLTRTDLAERVRREVGGPVAVAAPAALRDDLAAALLSGRCDHIVLTEER